MTRIRAFTFRNGMMACIAVIALTAVASVGDAAKGADVFKMCASCNAFKNGAGDGSFGPNLFGVSGGAAAAAANFGYSAAIKKSTFVWTDDKLIAWVRNPHVAVPGAKMAMVHTPTATSAENVVADIGNRK